MKLFRMGRSVASDCHVPEGYHKAKFWRVRPGLRPSLDFLNIVVSEEKGGLAGSLLQFENHEVEEEGSTTELLEKMKMRGFAVDIASVVIASLISQQLVGQFGVLANHGSSNWFPLPFGLIEVRWVRTREWEWDVRMRRLSECESSINVDDRVFLPPSTEE